MPQLQISLPPLSSLRGKTLGTKEKYHWRYCFVFVEVFLTGKKYHKDKALAFSLKASLSHVKPCLNPLSGFRRHGYPAYFPQLFGAHFKKWSGHSSGCSIFQNITFFYFPSFSVIPDRYHRKEKHGTFL